MPGAAFTFQGAYMNLFAGGFQLQDDAEKVLKRCDGGRQSIGPGGFMAMRADGKPGLDTLCTLK